MRCGRRSTASSTCSRIRAGSRPKTCGGSSHRRLRASSWSPTLRYRSSAGRSRARSAARSRCVRRPMGRARWYASCPHAIA
jgi:hypothetical protein